jgi:predicted NBD/HSP70 family sugar kinase
MSDSYLLIGIDGGATKVSAWGVERDILDNSFELSSLRSEAKYSDMDGYNSEFKPVEISRQLNDMKKGIHKVTVEEVKQGRTYITACAEVIVQLANQAKTSSVVVGIGMPGLKTTDRRGIAALANGPRMFAYANEVESLVEKNGINFAYPIAHIGSDADYCGIGEKYARNGSFKTVKDAYYLGGGTGTADALLIDSQLIPFDQTKTWLAKTWEMKNDRDISMEKYASASGIQFIYSGYSGIPVSALNEKNIYSPEIATRAINGESAAQETCTEIANYLSMLLYERISTLYHGSSALFSFVNPDRKPLDSEHPYKGKCLERIVIGQRLADLLKSRAGFEILTKPLIQNLSKLIDSSDGLDEAAKAHYLHGNVLREEIIFYSPLREAPALGAGIDGHFSATTATEMS